MKGRCSSRGSSSGDSSSSATRHSPVAAALLTPSSQQQKTQVVVIMGANSGIGYEAALRLAELRATVVLGVRNLGEGSR